MKTRMDDRARVDRLSFVVEFSQAARNTRATGDALSLAPGFSRVWSGVICGETVLTVSQIPKA